jgi:ubiquitin-protein ligase E3 A
VQAGDLKKTLKVKFIGEEGIDEGGVQKEFFQLMVAELFDAKWGMLTCDADTRLFWFNRSSFDSVVMFELLGILYVYSMFTYSFIGGSTAFYCFFERRNACNTLLYLT